MSFFQHHLRDFFASASRQVRITAVPASDVILYLIVEALAGVRFELPRVLFDSCSYCV